MLDKQTSNDRAGRGERAARIRALNDALRTTGIGGRVLVTQGVMAMSVPQRSAIIRAITQFSDWNGDNDPYDEHDCAFVTVGSDVALFKIDYYDLSLSAHSPDPADPLVTTRVLTIMLAEEY